MCLRNSQSYILYAYVGYAFHSILHARKTDTIIDELHGGDGRASLCHQGLRIEGTVSCTGSAPPSTAIEYQLQVLLNGDV